MYHLLEHTKCVTWPHNVSVFYVTLTVHTHDSTQQHWPVAALMGAVYCAVRTETVYLFRRTSGFRPVSHVYRSNCDKALPQNGTAEFPTERAVTSLSRLFAWDDGRVRKIVCEVPALLGRYTALVGSYLPTVWSLKMGPINVGNYQSTLCNAPEDRRHHLQRGGSLK
jgi:hypothetical protein